MEKIRVIFNVFGCVGACWLALTSEVCGRFCTSLTVVIDSPAPVVVATTLAEASWIMGSRLTSIWGALIERC